jgi:ABC-type transport system substrate-binding protein/DNA-binding SARP family transcriptional activator
VLACLVIQPGHTVTRAALTDHLWGEHVPRGAPTTIQTYVSHLRDLLEPHRDRGDPPSVLVTANGGYRLEVDRSSIDSVVFERAVEHGRALLRSGDARDAAAAAAELHIALSTWRGDALADLLEYEFAREESSRLGELRLVAAEAAADACLTLGREAEVIATVKPLLVANPMHERLHEQLMLALYRSGRQAEALDVHGRLAARLADELGVDPGPAVQALHLAILRQNSRLDLPAGRDGSAAGTDEGLGERGGPAPDAVPGVPGAPVAPAAWRRPRARPVQSVAHWLSRARLGTLAGLIAVAVVVATVAGIGLLRPWGGSKALGTLAANAVNQLDDTGAVVASVDVGTNPVALAFARGAIWLVNASDDTVSKVDPATRTVQQVLDVGRAPRSVAVTGDDLWVANLGDGTVTRINVLASRVVDTIDVGSGPAALAAGPAGLWVANSGDNTVQQIDTSTGGTDDPVDVGDGPDGLAVDATSVWVANGRAGSVTRLDARTGEPTFPPIRVGIGPRGIVRAGDDVWVANELSQTVTRIAVRTGRTRSIDVGDGPTAVAVHRGAVWVAEKYSGDLVRIDPRTEGTTRLAARGAARGLAVVDGRMWVASGAMPSTSHRGGVLRVAAGALPGKLSGLDPANVYDITTSHLERVVYDGLLAYHYASADPQVLVPDLATSVPEPTDGGRTYTFNLRTGIRYSTGDPVKASDLVRGVQRALLAPAGRREFYTGIVGGRACIHDTACDLRRGVVADDATGRVTFHLRAPDPQFLHKLTLLVVPAPAGTPLQDLRGPLPGTGPYRIASSTPGKELTLTRNGFFRQWAAGAQPAGFVDEMTWRKVASVRAAAAAVEEGRADLAELTPLGEIGANLGPLVDTLRVHAASRVHSSPLLATYFAVLNSSVPPFNKLQARRAFSYAIDRREIVRLLGGKAVSVATCQLLPPGMPGYTPYCPYSAGSSDREYQGPDLARARAAVRASRTYGTRVTVTDVVGDPNPPLESYLAGVLRRLGYRVTLRRLPNTHANNQFLYDRRNRIQVETGGWFADFPLPSNFYDVVACSGDLNPYPTGYCDHDLDRRAAAATTALQTDPAAALRMWTRIDHDVTDQVAVVPVTNDVNWWVTSERVGNYQGGGRDVGPLMSQLWVR